MRLALALVVSLSPTAALAASLTLSPGDDVGALTSSLGPGDVIRFNPGIYELDGTVTWTGAGTSDQPIRFVGDGDAILRGVGSGHVLRVQNASFVEIEGLIIEGSDERFANEDDDYNGLRVESSTDVTVRGVEIRNTGATLLVTAGDTARLTFVGLHLHDSREGNGLYAGCGDASCWMADSSLEGSWIHDLPADGGDGVELGNGCQANRFTDNVIHDVGGRGFLTRSTEYGAGNVIEGNAVFRARESGMRIGGAALVRNNLVFDIEGDGLVIEDERDALQDAVISFNTVWNTGSWAARLEDWIGRSGMVFANNALANPTGYGLRAREEHVDGSAYIVGNVVTGLVEGVLDPALDQYHPGAGAADFVDASLPDLYPSETSSLLNAADPSGESWVPEVDFNGLARDGAAPEVGAYEFYGTGNPGWAVAPGFKTLTDHVDDAEDVGAGCCGGKGDAEDALLVVPGLLFALRRRVRGRRATG